MDDLARNIEEQGMHKFRAGRTSTHKAQNDFEEGYLILANGKKIKEFVTRTLRDAGAIHGDDDIFDDPVDEMEQELPMPNMLIDGRLVDGAEEPEGADGDLFGDLSRAGSDTDDGSDGRESQAED